MENNNSIREFTCNDCQEVTKVDWSKVRPDLDDGTSNIGITFDDGKYIYVGECDNCGNLVEIEPPVPELKVTNVEVDREGMYIEVTDTVTNRSCWIEAWKDKSGDWEWDYNQYIFHLDDDNDVIAKMFQEDLGNYAEEVDYHVMSAINEHEDEYNKLQENKAPTMRDRLKEIKSGKTEAKMSENDSDPKFYEYVKSLLDAGAIDDPKYYESLSDEEKEDLIRNTWMKDADIIKDYKNSNLNESSSDAENKKFTDESISNLLQEIQNKVPDDIKYLSDYAYTYKGLFIEIRPDTIFVEEDANIVEMDFAIFRTEEDMNTDYETNIATDYYSMLSPVRYWEAVKLVCDKCLEKTESKEAKVDKDYIVNEIKSVIDGMTDIDITKVSNDMLDNIADIIIDDKVDVDSPEFDEKVVSNVRNMLDESKEAKIGTADQIIESKKVTESINTDVTYLVQQRSALDGKLWWVVVAHSNLTDKETVEGKFKNRKDAEEYKSKMERAYNDHKKTTEGVKTESKRKAINIEWDTDGEDVDLPTEIEIPDDIADEDIGDYITDETGFCHFGFDIAQDVKTESASADVIEYFGMQDNTDEEYKNNVAKEYKTLRAKYPDKEMILNGDFGTYLGTEKATPVEKGEYITVYNKVEEDVNIEISEDGKEVEITTDDHEEVEVKDETPDEDNEEKSEDEDTEEVEVPEEDIDELEENKEVKTEATDEKQYEVSLAVNGYYRQTVWAKDEKEAYVKVDNLCADADFGELEDIEWEKSRITTLDESKKVTESKTSDMDTVAIIMELEGGELTIEDADDWNKVKEVARNLQGSQGFYGRLLRSMLESEEEFGGVENLPYPITM